MTKKNLPELAQKVKYVRIKPAADGAPAELIHGEGTVVGLIIGIQQRVQVLVKEDGSPQNKAWTLEPFCINPTEREAEEYLSHHVKLQIVVDEYNKSSQAAIDAGNTEVDRLNAKMFGEPLVL